MTYQHITIIGNVGREPEMKYTPNGVGVCDFSVAVNRVWTDKNSNEKKQKTTWFRVKAWRQLAETCSQYVTKGMQVMVTGEVEVQAYMGNDGQPKASMEIVAREVRFLGRRDGTGTGSSGGYTPSDEDAPPWSGDAGGYTDDDIPF